MGKYWVAKFMQKIFSALQLKLSRSEICVANFIPPVSQNDYFLPKSIHQNYQVLLKLQIQKKIQFFILNIDPCKSWDNWGQSLSQTDRKTNSLTPYTGVSWFFLSLKFATSLTRFTRRGITIKVVAYFLILTILNDFWLPNDPNGRNGTFLIFYQLFYNLNYKWSLFVFVSTQEKGSKRTKRNDSSLDCLDSGFLYVVFIHMSMFPTFLNFYTIHPPFHYPLSLTLITFKVSLFHQVLYNLLQYASELHDTAVTLSLTNAYFSLVNFKTAFKWHRSPGVLV